MSAARDKRSRAELVELADRWLANREPVHCVTEDYEYIGGWRIRRAPGADEQARRMR